MSIRKRKWVGPAGETKFAWVVDFKDLGGVRRLRTFRLKKEADRHATKVRAELLDAELKAKGPATVAAVPDHGSTNPDEGIDMNVKTNTTSEHPWEAAHRLAKELSQAMGACNDGRWFAYVMPPQHPRAFDGFGSFPMSHEPDAYPIDRVNRLCWELSEALSQYQGGRFQAMVLPSTVGGHTVMLTSVKAFGREVTR